MPDGRSLARRVGTGAPLIDAIGDAASTLPGPSPLSTEMLACLAAVANTLSELPEQVSPFRHPWHLTAQQDALEHMSAPLCGFTKPRAPALKPHALRALGALSVGSITASVLQFAVYFHAGCRHGGTSDAASAVACGALFGVCPGSNLRAAA